MRRHWQRRPLLVRGAFSAFEDPLSPRQVLALAGDDRAASRLVRRIGTKWTLEHGPIPASRLRALPARGWTVLVQDANHFSSRAARLLQAFDFIPHARVDDVMVSYAAPGGGVGPHVDSYDVFLLQGRGRRRWRISRQRDHEFIPGLPLKVLRRFEPDQEWLLEAGDMLYLPPGVAHDGVAETECLTWSIGFRAPGDAEFAQGFLDFLRDRIELEGQYADPGEEAADSPGEVPARMLEHARRTAARIRFAAKDVDEFTGRFLSEPKPHVFFEPPRSPLSPARFAAAAHARGLALDARSRLLFSGSMFFMNGERAAVPARARPLARQLADRRELPPRTALGEDFLALAHGWYAQGFLVLGEEAT